MRSLKLPFLGLLLLAPVVASAQPADPEAPPSVLVVEREEIKPGRMSQHEKAAGGFATLLAKADPEGYWLGLTPVSGDENVILYLQGFPSFAAAEASIKKIDEAFTQNVAWKPELERLSAQSADVHASQRSAYYVHRPALSYRPGKRSELGKARYMSITTLRVKPGRIPDFIDYAKSLNAARDKANATWVSAAVFQAATGAPAGTFLVISRLQSLAELDEVYAKADDRQKAIDAALGGDQIAKMRRELISEILLEAPTTSTYAFSRENSRPAPFVVSADPDFWTPKSASASGKALATKKEAPKQ